MPTARYYDLPPEAQAVLARLFPHLRPLFYEQGTQEQERTTTATNTFGVPDSHIPRPPNSWILYRLSRIAEAQALVAKDPSRAREVPAAAVSGVIAKWWKAEPEEVKAIWKAKAQRAKEEHARKYPGYKYRPKLRRAASDLEESVSQSNLDRPLQQGSKDLLQGVKTEGNSLVRPSYTNAAMAALGDSSVSRYSAVPAIAQSTTSHTASSSGPTSSPTNNVTRTTSSSTLPYSHTSGRRKDPTPGGVSRSRSYTSFPSARAAPYQQRSVHKGTTTDTSVDTSYFDVPARDAATQALLNVPPASRPAPVVGPSNYTPPGNQSQYYNQTHPAPIYPYEVMVAAHNAAYGLTTPDWSSPAFQARDFTGAAMPSYWPSGSSNLMVRRALISPPVVTGFL